MTQPDGTVRPLEGLRILELARAQPGQLAGRLLADMGADVVRVDLPIEKPPTEERRRAALSYLNRNKRSVGLDLKDPAGRRAFLRLADHADVLLEGFRPGVMARLGLDHESLAARNPRLITCSLSGYGQRGPKALRPGHDITYLAAAGVLGLLGEPGQRPLPPMNLVADYGGASLHGALGIVLAVLARERTGRGQHVDVSYARTSLALLAATPNMELAFDGTLPTRGGGVAGGGYAFYTTYETADGRYLAVGCNEHHLWRNFCDALGRPDLNAEVRRWEHHHRMPNEHETAVRDQVAAVIATRPLAEWEEIFGAADVAVEGVRTAGEIVADAATDDGGVVELEHPEFGLVRQFGLPFVLSDTPGRADRAASYSGEDTTEVLREAGVSDAELAELRSNGTIT